MANFSSAPLTYTVSGTISGPGGAGATVNLTGSANATTTADSSGSYSFSGLSNGSYIVAAANAGYVFTPASQTVNVSGGNAVANFASALQTYTITGTSADPAERAQVLVSLALLTRLLRLTARATTASAGCSTALILWQAMPDTSSHRRARRLTSVVAMLWQILPQRSRLTPSPAPSADRAERAQVLVSLALLRDYTTDGSGNYSFGGLLNGAYTVTPANPVIRSDRRARQ